MKQFTINFLIGFLGMLFIFFIIPELSDLIEEYLLIIIFSIIIGFLVAFFKK